MSANVRCALSRRVGGMTLIELMVSLVLGLIVVGGATSVIIANQQSYRTNEGLSQVQESARTAFELMSRDVRQAGVIGCNNNGRVVNVLDSTPPLLWWQTWFGIAGYESAQPDGAAPFGTASGQRVPGTDSIQLQGVDGAGLSVELHTPSSAIFEISAPTTAIADNDIVMVCDFDHAAIFRVTTYNNTNATIAHATGVGLLPRNCSPGLGYPTACTFNNAYTFVRNSQIARLRAVEWYVGRNLRVGETGFSLFRLPSPSSGVGVPEEVVSNVTDMQIQYRVEGGNSWVDANLVGAGAWVNVEAVRIRLTLQSADARVTTTSVNSGRLQRTFTNIIALRNRVP